MATSDIRPRTKATHTHKTKTAFVSRGLTVFFLIFDPFSTHYVTQAIVRTNTSRSCEQNAESRVSPERKSASFVTHNPKRMPKVLVVQSQK